MKKSLWLIILMMVASMQMVKAETKLDPVQLAKEKKRLMKRKVGLTSRVTSKRMEKAFRYIRKENYNHAIQVLVDLLKQTRNRKYEFAQVWQNLGFAFAQKGDMDKAIKALANSLKLEQLPYTQTLSSMYTMAQLQMAKEKYTEAEATLEKWFAFATNANDEAYILMASIKGQLQKQEKALKYVNTAITNANKAGRAPKEKWLQFALALNHEMGKYANAKKILVQLTASYPTKAKYWKQLSSTYLSLKEDSKALATMELAHKLGHIKAEGDLKNIVSLYMYLDLPHKGAQFLEQQMLAGTIKSSEDNLKTLAQAWLMAREKNKALATYEKAAEKSETGNLFVQKGYLQIEDEKWNDALSDLNKAIRKGKLKKPAKVHFAKAVAQYNLKNLSGALKTLFVARKIDNKDKTIKKWIDQIQSEQVAMNTVADSSIKKQ